MDDFLISKTIINPGIQFCDSSLLTVPLSSLSCSVVPVGTTTPITATVTTTTHPGVYTIHCSPIKLMVAIKFISKLMMSKLVVLH